MKSWWDTEPDDEPGLMVELNTTPLIDVLLVLLVMLIITIPMHVHSVGLELPVASTQPSSLEPVVVLIDIDADASLLWDGVPLADLAALQLRLDAALPSQPEIHVRPHPAARYERVVAVLATAQRTGLAAVGVVGSER